MRRVTLDFTNISLRYELHLALRKAFGFPDYYGMNLDALHDCLTDIREYTEIELVGTEELAANLGRYGEAALRVLSDSVGENELLRLRRLKTAGYCDEPEENE